MRIVATVFFKALVPEYPALNLCHSGESERQLPKHSGFRYTICMKPLRALLIALLLIALPLQGIAAFAPKAACADHHAAQGGEHHHAAQTGKTDNAPAHDHHQNNNDPAETAGGHSCCHNVTSAAAPALVLPPPEAPQILATRIPLLNTLYIPELPQRPPRA